MKHTLHTRKSQGVGDSFQKTAFSGAGFAPDLMSDHALSTFPEACKTTLNEGVYGAEGMYPPPGDVGRPLVPGYPEGGTGGAGTMVTTVSAPRTRV